jgi:hypothetical protein
MLRPVPASLLKNPEPSGPCNIEPSMHSASSAKSPRSIFERIARASTPVSSLTLGCHNKFTPKPRSSSNQPDAPRSRIDIVHPPQPPACNQSTLKGFARRIHLARF